MNYPRRALLMLNRDGPRALLRAAYRHFVRLPWRGVLFVDDATMPRPRTVWPEGYRFELWDSVATLPPAARAALDRVASPGFLLSHDTADGVYLVWYGDELAAYGAIVRRSPHRAVLGLPSTAVLVSSCLTAPAHRRRGLFRGALNETVRQLRPRHGGAIYIEAVPENRASLAGIRSAGFKELGLVNSVVWFGALVHRSGRWHRLRGESHV